MLSYDHIVVVCDDGPDGDEAVIAATALARQAGSRLTLLAVAETDPPSARRCCGFGSAAWERCEIEDAHARLRRAALLAGEDQPPATSVVLGRRAAAIATAIEGLDGDLVVVPAAPRGVVARLAARDLAPGLRRRSRVPVLQTPRSGRRRVPAHALP